MRPGGRSRGLVTPRWALALGVLAGSGLAALSGSPAWAHEERQAVTPDGSGSVPEYRTAGPTLLVCKTDPVDFTRRIAAFDDELIEANQALWEQCQTSGFRHVQAAVDAVAAPGTIIKILPGEYLEEPSLADPTPECTGLPTEVLSYEQQVACPHLQNLVAILGKEQLQIEGTGATPEDVVIDAGFRARNAIRADRSNGIYLRNLTAQRTTGTAVHIMETDGFAVDTVVGRWNDEYGFLALADDHGLVAGCEAYGNGGAGIAGHLTPVRDTHSIEVRNCYSHDNLLGYSGRGGNSAWVHDNRFLRNSVGVATGSALADQPLPAQRHAVFERNSIGINNADYYGHVRDGTCARPAAERGYEQGVVCPAEGVPPGTGVLSPGGNDNIWRDNWVYGNSYAGFVTSWLPGLVRGDSRLSAQIDTSHHNRYYGNHLGLTPDGEAAPNGMDFWWDGQGLGSCWQAPTAGSEPLALPACGADDLPAGLGTARFVGEPGKLVRLYACSGYDLATATVPGGCAWYGARGLERLEVRFALAEAVLLAVVLVVVWLRLLPWSGLGALGIVLSLAGLVVGVFGTADDASLLTPVGLNLLGAGWLVVGVMLFRKRHPGSGFLTAALGVLALVGALDRGIWMIPWVPVPPSMWRIAIEAFWVPAALWVAIRGQRRAAPAPRKRTRRRRLKPTGDPIEAFTANLRRL